MEFNSGFKGLSNVCSIERCNDDVELVELTVYETVDSCLSVRTGPAFYTSLKTENNYETRTGNRRSADLKPKTGTPEEEASLPSITVRCCVTV